MEGMESLVEKALLDAELSAEAGGCGFRCEGEGGDAEAAPPLGRDAQK